LRETAGNTWSFGISTAQDSGFAESFFAISLYVYRPSTDTVVGYITDSDTPRGTEWANNKEGRTFTISGSAVMAQAGDVLVLEVWRHAFQTTANDYNQILYFDATTDVTEGRTASAASYLETSQNLTFGVAKPTTPIGITRQASWGSGAGWPPPGKHAGTSEAGRLPRGRPSGIYRYRLAGTCGLRRP
jgi:hypothetical protein